MATELFTLKRMAEYFNVTKQYINKLKNGDSNFPEPHQKIGRTYLYTKEQVDAYGKLKDFETPHPNRVDRIQREEREGKE